MTYNPAFKHLSQVIRKNFPLLYADEQVKKLHLFLSEARET